jgi:hypothetical protein
MCSVFALCGVCNVCFVADLIKQKCKVQAAEYRTHVKRKGSGLLPFYWYPLMGPCRLGMAALHFNFDIEVQNSLYMLWSWCVQCASGWSGTKASTGGGSILSCEPSWLEELWFTN